MSNFTYKRTTVQNMKIVGVLDTSTMTIDVDGELKNLRTLLSDYTDNAVEINIKLKDEEELDEPVE